MILNSSVICTDTSVKAGVKYLKGFIAKVLVKKCLT